MSAFAMVYRRWLRDRAVSTFVWAAGSVIIVVATAAFYPSLAGLSTEQLGGGGEAMSSLLGLFQGIDPGSPLGYLWIALCVAFLLGGASGRKGLALGVASGVAIGGYVLYTLSNMTGSLEALTWLAPWRWYVDKAMLVNGLDWEVVLPFITATVGFLAGWLLFLRRDLQNP